MKRIGVVLCGCGHRDGSEVHEATLTLLAIDQSGARAVPISPDGDQRFVRNHMDGSDMKEKRDIMVESARISRGNIKSIKDITADDLDALIIPGGQGAALNLSSYIEDGVDCKVDADLERLVFEMWKNKKPIGAICIAPVTLAKILSKNKIFATITIGNDSKVAADLKNLGMKHRECPASDCVVDEEHKIVTTPAYMTAKGIAELWKGISKLVGEVIRLTK
ncbi:MAG: isoprenoid biosynthesis glyoxalase ElbB [Pseudomonadota bacterium]